MSIKRAKCLALQFNRLTTQAHSQASESHMQLMHRKMLKKTRTAQCLRVREEKRNRLRPALRYKSKICLISLSHCAQGFGIGPAEILDSLTWRRYRAHCPKRLQFPSLCSNEGITSRSDPAASRNFPARVGPKSRQSSSTTKRRFLRIRHWQHQALHESVQEACEETNALLSSAWDKCWYVTL